MSQKKLLFLTLNTFSSTGGIEKVCRVAGKALYEIAHEEDGLFSLYSMNDKADQLDEKYLPAGSFRSFSGNKLKFVRQAIAFGKTCDTVILSHINLLIIGLAVKLISPKTKLVLIAHGIEVWEPLSAWKKSSLKKFDLILPVSEFTKDKMQTLYGLPANKFRVLNNCLDPYLQKKFKPGGNGQLKEKYGFGKNDIILFTLTRLKSSEQYKGYDKVISVLPAILEKYPGVKYFIAGKYDTEEKQRLDKLIDQLQLKNKVIFSGFVADEDVEACFTLADIYIMPSTGEGFGIVFIEALFYEKPVIAGNVDGSVDALDKGRFGLLVNPDNSSEIENAVFKVLENKEDFIPDQAKVMENFGFQAYKSAMRDLLKIA